MMNFGTSSLRYESYPYLPYIGNKDSKYTITITENNNMTAWFTRSFLTLPIYYQNVECVINTKKVLQHTPEKSKQSPEIYFLVNDSLFLVNFSDRPITNWETWIPYESQYCTAFFISALRHSTKFIFDDCSIPVFPLPFTCGMRLDHRYLEHCHSLNREKDIPIFFNGRHSVRVVRKHIGKIIKRHFPNAHVSFLDDQAALSSQEYIDLMSRSKIVWCPRSIWSPPDADCNISPVREFESMCLECLVVKHPLGITEPEERTPGVHFVEYRNDNSDLIAKLEYYLEHDAERNKIAHNGRLWWERNSSMSARATYMMTRCLQSMKEPYQLPKE